MQGATYMNFTYGELKPFYDDRDNEKDPIDKILDHIQSLIEEKDENISFIIWRINDIISEDLYLNDEKTIFMVQRLVKVVDNIYEYLFDISSTGILEVILEYKLKDPPTENDLRFLIFSGTRGDGLYIGKFITICWSACKGLREKREEFHFAIEEYLPSIDYKSMKNLLENGLDIHAVDEYGNNLLFRMLKRDWYRSGQIELLLENNPNDLFKRVNDTSEFPIRYEPTITIAKMMFNKIRPILHDFLNENIVNTIRRSYISIHI